MTRTAITRRATWIGLLVTGLLTVGASSTWARAATRFVRFHGYVLSVPSSWPVFDLTRDPGTCVRFDRHAVYLGTPSDRQRCPAHAVGRTEAVLVQSLPAGAAARSVRSPGSAPAVGGLASAGLALSFGVPSAGLLVTATWWHHRALLSRVLRRRLAAASAHRVTRAPQRRADRPPGIGSNLRRHRHGAGARVIPAEAAYGGLGFDACQAPSASAMAAWSLSPFRAVGVYIGGLNAACSQPNLTPSWVSTQVAAGWHLILTYVGLQGAGSCSGTCATIDPTQATAEGTAAAVDAVGRAQALGIPAGNPIYDDMEQYSQSPVNTKAVLAFLSGWTSQLHAEGYLSGVYSSASAAITDLVKANGTGYTEPDDIWFAHWNGQATTADPYVPSADWVGQQRLHQYSGDHTDTYGGVSLDIDSDYVNGATADTSSPIPDGTFIQVTGTTAVYEVAGGAPLLVSAWTPFGAAQPVDFISPGTFAQLAPYPANGTFLTAAGGASYRMAGGVAFEVDNPALFPGLLPGVTVDPWNLSNIGNPASRLLAAPINGTVVEGLPSGAYWCFSGGYRTALSVTPGAVAVDDQALTPFAQVSQPGMPGCSTPVPQKAAPQCVVPRLKHMGLKRARGELRRALCRVGKVRRPRRWGRHHLLRVFGQSVRPQSKRPAGSKVNLRLL